MNLSAHCQAVLFHAPLHTTPPPSLFQPSGPCRRSARTGAAQHRRPLEGPHRHFPTWRTVQHAHEGITFPLNTLRGDFLADIVFFLVMHQVPHTTEVSLLADTTPRALCSASCPRHPRYPSTTTSSFSSGRQTHACAQRDGVCTPFVFRVRDKTDDNLSTLRGRGGRLRLPLTPLGLLLR